MDPMAVFFLEWQQRLVRFFQARGLSEDDAQAFTDEAMLRFLKGGYPPSRPILWRISRNLLVDHWRARESEQKIIERVVIEWGDKDDPPPNELEHLEMAEILKNALQRLSLEQRTVIKMKWMEGIGLGQISRVLGISEEAVEGRDKRGRAALKKDPCIRRLTIT
jgi:RNA polymerase sigma-70 factor (ECF subfamily)